MADEAVADEDAACVKDPAMGLLPVLVLSEGVISGVALPDPPPVAVCLACCRANRSASILARSDKRALGLPVAAADPLSLDVPLVVLVELLGPGADDVLAVEAAVDVPAAVVAVGVGVPVFGVPFRLARSSLCLSLSASRCFCHVALACSIASSDSVGCRGTARGVDELDSAARLAARALKWISE